ncbi:DUF4652 domain-containing protein [Bacillus cereus group sp. BY105LC]|uniref:DUF4652 domain-containing protein n=1 Tax=Bacillus cereus group sp. BY105LC TaxID=3018088 RepID=UPI0022E38119|nr:DUF4652 domain-containing protein [Bacillus cereus group sp. BY105LC]MDA1886883.1 DUF4652 domain-containing protein [Bacillus cereus group sp. BY105LC]
MYQLKYRRSDNRIELITEYGEKKLLNDSISSKPTISPGGLKAIYLSPCEWESITKLYLFDLRNGDNIQLIGDIDGAYIPKGAIWIDNSYLALIIGFGTFSDGGNVYLYNLMDSQLIKITDWDQRKQVVKLEYNSGFLKFKGIEYLSDIMEEYIEFKEILDIKLYTL